jgi:hypothetical protein
MIHNKNRYQNTGLTPLHYNIYNQGLDNPTENTKEIAQ